MDEGNGGSDGGTSRRYNLEGTSSPGDTVLLFRDSCSATAEATTTADSSGNFSFVVEVASAGRERFFVRVPSGDGGLGACCGNGQVVDSTFEVDSQPPGAPTNLVWRPETSTGCGQIVVGQTESRARVFLFSDADCTQPVELCNAESPFQAGFDGEFVAYTNLPNAVPETLLFARARDSSGNLGACGGPAQYVGPDAGVLAGADAGADAGASDGGM